MLFYCPTFGWIGNVPNSFFDPPISIAIFFNGFLNPGAYIIIDIILLLCILFILLGIKAKLSTRLFSILSVFALSFQYSFGKIDHLIMIYAMLFILSFSGWGDDLAIIPDKTSTNGSVSKSTSVIAVTICFTFFTAGFRKALHWMNFDFNKSGTGSWYYPRLHRKLFFLAPYPMHMPFWSFKLMDFATVFFELSPILFLLYSFRSWRLYLLLVIIFHLIILLVLNISFMPQAVVYLVFVDFSGFYARIVQLSKMAAVRFIAFVFLTTATAARIYYIFDLNRHTTLFVDDVDFLKTLTVGIFIFIVSGLILGRFLFKKREFGEQQLLA